MVQLLLLLLLLSTCSTTFATAVSRASAPQPVHINFTISASQFSSCESASALKQQLNSIGCSLNLNYNQLAAGIQLINYYFSQRARSGSDPGNCGFVTPEYASSAPQKVVNRGTGNYSYAVARCAASAGPGHPSMLSGDTAAYGESASACVATDKDTDGTYNTVTSASVTGNNTGMVSQYGGGHLESLASTPAAFDGTRYVYYGQNDSALSGSCAADGPGATAFAELLTTLTIPVNMTGQVPTVSYGVSGTCEAGTYYKTAACNLNQNCPRSDTYQKRSETEEGLSEPIVVERSSPRSSSSSPSPQPSVGSSASGMQASPANSSVSVSVDCEGRRTTTTAPQLSFAVSLNGTYSPASGFMGTFVVVRNASASLSCS